MNTLVIVMIAAVCLLRDIPCMAVGWQKNGA